MTEPTRLSGVPRFQVTRRDLLRTGAAAGLAAPLGLVGATVLAQSVEPRPLKLAWNTGGVCTSPVAYAFHRGVFKKYGLAVEIVNFAGSTEMLLEALATGKADAAIGMTLRWLKPLEQGFDVKLVAGTHGGCMRLLGSKAAGINTLADLKGKVVAVNDLGSPAKNFFAILLAKQGFDPNQVDWRVFPGDLLGTAVEKGEAQAIAQDMITKYGDKIKGVHCANDNMAYGVLQALKAEGINLPVTAFDGNPEAVEMVMKGDLLATVFTNPHWGGGIALGLAHQAALGKFKPSEEPKEHREFYGPSILVTKADADAFKKKYLDSTPKYDWSDRWGLSAGQIQYK